MTDCEVIDPTEDSEGCTMWWDDRILAEAPCWDLLVLTPDDFHFTIFSSEVDLSRAQKKIRRGVDAGRVFEDIGTSVMLADIVRIARETTDIGFLRIDYTEDGKDRKAAVSCTSEVRQEVFEALEDHFGRDMRLQEDREGPMRSATTPLAITIVVAFITMLVYFGAKAADPPPVAPGGVRMVDNRVEGIKTIGRYLGGPLILVIGGAACAGCQVWMVIAIARRPMIPVLKRVPRRRARSDGQETTTTTEFVR